MGYRIDYAAQSRGYSAKLSAGRIFLLSAVIFCVFAFSVREFWDEGWSVLKTMLLPGDLSAVKTAAEDFVYAIQGGVSFSEAVTSFCLQILSDG